MKKFLTSFPTIITAAIIAISSIVTGLSFSIKNQISVEAAITNPPAGESLFRMNGEHNYDLMLDIADFVDLLPRHQRTNGGDGLNQFAHVYSDANDIRTANGGTVPEFQLFESLDGTTTMVTTNQPNGDHNWSTNNTSQSNMSKMKYRLVYVTYPENDDPILTFMASEVYRRTFFNFNEYRPCNAYSVNSDTSNDKDRDVYGSNLCLTLNYDFRGMTANFSNINQFLKTPNDVGWQTAEAYYVFYADEFRYIYNTQPNIGLIDDGDMNTFNNGLWGSRLNEKIWIPSVFEMGSNYPFIYDWDAGDDFWENFRPQPQNGLWSLTPTEREFESAFSTDFSWTRSAYDGEYGCIILRRQGGEYGRTWIDGNEGVRPAMHISLPHDTINYHRALRTINQLNTENAALNATLLQKQAEITNLETTIGTTVPPTGLRGEIANLTAQITQKDGQISTLTTEKNNLYNSIHDPDTGYLAQIAARDTEIERLDGLINDPNTGYLKQIADLTAQKNALQELYDIQNTVTIPALNGQIATLTGEKQELYDLINDPDTGYLRQISDLTNQIQNLNTDKTNLQTDLTNAQIEYGILNGLYQQLLIDDGENLETIEFFRGKIETLETMTIPNLQSQITAKDTEISTKQGQIDTFNNVTIPNLNGQITAKDTEILQKQGQLDTLNNVTIPNLNGQISNKQSQIDNLNNITIPNLNGQISTLTSERNTAQNSLTTANENLTLKTNQLTAANNDKIALENQVTERNTTIYGLNTQLTKAKSDYDDLVRVYNTLERQNSNLKDQIAKLQNENKSAAAEQKSVFNPLVIGLMGGIGILSILLLLVFVKKRS